MRSTCSTAADAGKSSCSVGNMTCMQRASDPPWRRLSDALHRYIALWHAMMDGSRVDSFWHNVLPDLRSMSVVSELLSQCTEVSLTSTAILLNQRFSDRSLLLPTLDVVGLEIVGMLYWACCKEA